MAIASKPKPTQKHHHKRQAAHHRRTKHYGKSYWPYLPMLLVLFGSFYLNTLWSRPAVLGASSDLTATTLTVDANNARRGQQALTLNTELTQAAQAKANDMAVKNYWSHQSPDGRSPWDFIGASGYQYVASGENLAFGFNDADDVTKAWLQSPEHRANMLNGRYSEVGFGVAQSADYLNKGPQTIVVAMYATPGNGVQSAPVVPLDKQPVSRISTVIGSASAGLFIGVIGALGLVYVVGRHSIAWRRLVNRGELFVIQHPVFDISLITLAALAVLASQTAGYIG